MPHWHKFCVKLSFHEIFFSKFQECIGTREVLGETDEVQSSGKVFKKLELGDYRWISYNQLAVTGKSFSEALILASTNLQYDKRLFIELRVQYMKIASSTCCVHKLFCMSRKNQFLYTTCSPHVLPMF